jgi:hypothetical protein
MSQLKPFWGLVEQVGPWKTTSSDRQRSAMKDKPTIGGGIEAGGRGHAGHGAWKKIYTPYQVDATGSLPRPSDYAMRSVVTGPIDMKRQTKMGRVKKGVTMAARTPLQSGEKMGMSTQTENIEMGQRFGSEAGQVLPDLFTESVASEYGVETSPAETQTVPIETSISMTQTPTRPMSIQKQFGYSIKPVKGKDAAAQTRERTFKEFGTQVVGTAAASTLGFITMNVPGAMIAGKKTYDYLAPDLEKDIEMQIDVPTFKPPPIDLSLSDKFMRSIMDYEEGTKQKRKQKMEKGYEERVELVKDRKTVPVPTGEGKKLAMSAKALGKMAEKRGLTVGAKAAGIIPEKPMKTNGLKIKPIKKSVAKKTVPSQPVTLKVIKALRKRVGDTKINLMFKTMKETNPQFKIFKAANAQWLKEK